MLNFRKGSIQDKLDQLFETITGAPVGSGVTPAAFCEARKKLRPEAFVALNQPVLESAYRYLSPVVWRGFRVLAVDGSTARLPAYPEIQEVFGGPSDSHVPMAFYDVLTGLLVRADLVAYSRGERELASQYLPDLQGDDLVLYDRGYAAFRLLAYHFEAQRHYCAQLRHDLHPEVQVRIRVEDDHRFR
jgi:hypothetical protein